MTWVAVVSGLVPLSVLAWILVHPETVEKWAGLIGRAASHVPGLWERGSKQYLKFDTQKRINAFTKGLATEGAVLAYERAEVRWVDREEDLGALAAQGRVIVRLDIRDQSDRGFLRGALLFVSHSFLAAAKKPLSHDQRSSLDIFVTRSMLLREKPQLVQIFDEDILGGDARTVEKSGYYDQFSLLSSRGLFWDVFLQEVTLLAQKNNLSVKEHERSEDIDGLLAFLCARAERAVGDLVECEYLTDTFRLALVYVGLAENVQQGGGVWTRYIRARLKPLGIDSIYVIARSQHIAVISEVATDLSADYTVVHSAERPYSLRRGRDLVEVEELVSLFRATNLHAPASLGVLDGIDDGPVFDAVLAARVPRAATTEPALLPDLPDGRVQVEVIAALGQFGFLRAGDFERVYFKSEWVSPFALPVHIGQTGTSEISRGEDDRAFARALRLEPPAVRWVGTIVSFENGFGRILPEGDLRGCRFAVKHWRGTGRVAAGMRVTFIPVLTASGNYRATNVVQADLP